MDRGDGAYRLENTALAVLAVVAVLIAAYAIIARPDDTAHDEKLLASALPDDYEPTLAAPVRASGHQCDRLCSASFGEKISGERTVRVTCTVAARKLTCTNAASFDITVSGIHEPSR